MLYTVTITPRTGEVQRITTWAINADRALNLVAGYFLCPASICTVKEAA